MARPNGSAVKRKKPNTASQEEPTNSTSTELAEDVETTPEPIRKGRSASTPKGSKGKQPEESPGLFCLILSHFGKAD